MSYWCGDISFGSALGLTPNMSLSLTQTARFSAFFALNFFVLPCPAILGHMALGTTPRVRAWAGRYSNLYLYYLQLHSEMSGLYQKLMFLQGKYYFKALRIVFQQCG